MAKIVCWDAVVGKFIEKEEQATKKPKLFYFMAYMNLTIVS